MASLAYRLLGSAADAEDAVQDAFLHGHAADRQRIKVPEPWPTKIVTNLCLDRLRSAQAHPRTHRRSLAARIAPRRRPDAQPRRHFRAALTLMERLSPLDRGHANAA
ncbi:sigma factor [Nonomuraea muscovyensis]|uniref:sigma factor n=1 Tax=Nonomuraea muscovyensis TaxID=1124761 RepID=UPI0028A90746|nr:sigma factor [Nonomuraea muscovyensis]